MFVNGMPMFFGGGMFGGGGGGRSYRRRPSPPAREADMKYEAERRRLVRTCCWVLFHKVSFS